MRISFLVVLLICFCAMPSYAQRSAHFTVSSSARLDPKEAQQLLSVLEWNRRIELQPLSLLKGREFLETTWRHELVHLVVDTRGQRRGLPSGPRSHSRGRRK